LRRPDSGFFDDRLSRLVQRRLPSIAIARLTKWVKQAARDVAQWRALDEHFAVGEFRLKLLGWDVERRFMVAREQPREELESAGRRLIDVLGCAFRVFVTGG
jgi:hypothetical protein